MAQAADEVISVRPDFRSGLWRGLSCPVLFKPFHFIPNASTLPRITPTAELVRDARERLGVSDGKSLVAYFGLLYPPRGVDQLFAIADPVKHYLAVVGGQIQSASNYYQALTRAAHQSAWPCSVDFKGFLPAEEAAA